MGISINKEGYKFIFPTLALAGLAVYFSIKPAAYFFLLGVGFFSYFFRDPTRVIPKQNGILVAPADGVVKRIFKVGKFREIYIFVRPLDVHINRSPVSGVVEKIEPKHGKHKMAFRKSATENEENYITINSGKNKIVVVQVVGFIARRIRCWVHTLDKIEIGQPIGMLLFSSGTRVIMPAKAKILVKEKQVIKAGETIIAKIK